MPVHTVRQGECISSIAFAFGLLPDTLWNHTENAELKKLRQDPNVLAPGDAVFIPEKRPAPASAGSEQRHRFRRKAVPEMLRIVLEDSHGKPRADVAYTVDVDGTSVDGRTADDGLIEVSIQPDASECNLYIEPEAEEVAEGEGEMALLDEDGSGYELVAIESGEEDGESEDDSEPQTEHYVFKLGGLDPLDTEEGFKQRLANLGYDTGNLDEAIRAFQSDAGLEPSGRIDSDTRSSLGERHHDAA